jgi:hypothetical protein
MGERNLRRNEQAETLEGSLQLEALQYCPNRTSILGGVLVLLR